MLSKKQSTIRRQLRRAKAMARKPVCAGDEPLALELLGIIEALDWASSGRAQRPTTWLTSNTDPLIMVAEPH